MIQLHKLINNNLIKGVGSILEIHHVSSKDDYAKFIKENGFKEDAKNIYKDWENVG